MVFFAGSMPQSELALKRGVRIRKVWVRFTAMRIQQTAPIDRLTRLDKAFDHLPALNPNIDGVARMTECREQ